MNAHMTQQGRGRFLAQTLLLLLAASAFPGCIFVVPGGGAGRLHEETLMPSSRFLEFNKIAMIEIDGVIGDGPFWSSSATVDDVRKRLDLAAADWRVKAVVLRINSPGGEVTASDVISREVRVFRQRAGKPVVACITATGASGAYYIALSSDKILCCPTAVTGSVGVIMGYVNVQGLFEKVGLRSEVIKSGELKDIGSATRPMTDKERQLPHELNNQLFSRFLEQVRASRPGLTDADAAIVRDGRIFTADQALAVHLIDGIAYLDEAVEQARALAGISGATVVAYRERRGYGSASIYSQGETSTQGIPEILEKSLRALSRVQGPGFYYLWAPGL